MVNDADPRKIITDSISESAASKQKLLESVDLLEQFSRIFVKTIENGGIIYFLGNGGSAADAQHLAAELVGRFAEERRSLPAAALTVNTSNLTAIANDYGYEHVFSRQLEGVLKKNDLVVAISTSGNSPNVLEAVKTARAMGCTTIGFTGRDGGKLKNLVDHCFKAPADKPSRIQEIHIMIGHILCHIVEQRFCSVRTLELS